ncbi:uncharacterized protein LOC133422448 isoform X2 [Cololabis saira]|uniref:uncharacterized protein LOC133422448 isoform X2 n=1 Tax=Cololabis saira TaxID=129043 RepID=UPI002AD26281|nr:uncharacterized protein LOC133422448 isoform X2 [Cololabis saira]
MNSQSLCTKTRTLCIYESPNQRANTVKEPLRRDQRSPSQEQPQHYMKPRPPSLPPHPRNVYSTAEDQGESHDRSPVNESAAKPQTLRKKPPPTLPKPLDRPPPSPLYYERPSSSMSSRSTSSRGSSMSSSTLSLVSAVFYEDAQQAQATRSMNRPASSSRRSSTSMNNISNSQIRPSPPSFRPPLPPLSPSGSAYYSAREYLTMIPAEDEMSLSGSERLVESDYWNYQYGPDSIYQLKADDIPDLLKWLKVVSRDPGATSPSLYGLSIEEEISLFTERAMNVRRARRLYNLLMMRHKEGLQSCIKDFQSICEKLEQVKKKNKTMGIAGGATGAVGGVAAVAGVALAPITMGISLIATAVGAGMMATAGGLGVHAAKTSQNRVRRTNIEKLVDSYKSEVADLELCLAFILSAMNELQRYDMVRLQTAHAHPEALRMARLSQSVLRSNVDSSGGMSLNHPGGGTSARLLKAFASEMDQYFTEDKGEKLNMSKKSKFSGIVHTLSKNLKEQLDYLIKMWELLN